MKFIAVLLLACASALAQTHLSPEALANPNGGVIAVIGDNGRLAFARLDSSVQLVKDSAGNLILRAAVITAPAPTVQVIKPTAAGTILTLTGAPKPGTLFVSAGGLVLAEGEDYTVSGKTITLVAAHAPRPGIIFQLRYQE